MTVDAQGNDPGCYPERVAAIEREISGCASTFGVDSWDKTFLANIRHRETLTTAQAATLHGIELKVFGPPDEPDEE